MSTVKLDDELRSRLNGLDRPLEFQDETGRTVGRFLPEDEYRRLLHDLARAVVSEEELDRVSQEPGGRSLAEIWKRLGRTA